MSFPTGSIAGFDALPRWIDGRELRLPGEILGALDHPELSVKVGARMLERVVADMRTWTAAGVAFGHVGVNVAATRLQDAALLRPATLRSMAAWA